jgi:predicted transcriptional regulator
VKGGYEFSANDKATKVESIEADELDANSVVEHLGIQGAKEEATAFIHKLALLFRISPAKKISVPEIRVSAIDNRKGVSIDLGDVFLFVQKEKSWSLQLYDTVESRSLTPYFHVGTIRELERHAVFKEALKLKFKAHLVPLIAAKIVEVIEQQPEEEWQVATRTEEAAEPTPTRIPVELPTSEDVSDVFAYQGDRKFNSRIQIKSTGFPQSRFLTLEFSCNRSREDLCSVCTFKGYKMNLTENFDASAFATYFDSDNLRDAWKVLKENGTVTGCDKISVKGENETAITQAIVSDRCGNEAKAWFIYEPEKCDLRTSPNWIYSQGWLCRGKTGRIGVLVTEFQAESEVLKPNPETVEASRQYLQSVTTEDEPTIWKVARALHKKSNLKGLETIRGFVSDLLFVGAPVWTKTPEGPAILAMTSAEIGETTTAKSQRERELSSWLKAGKYESGRKTTAGLAAGAEKIEGIGWVMRKGLLPSADLSFLVLDNMFPHALDEHIESRRNGVIELSTIKSCELWARARLKLLRNPAVPFDQHLHKCVALKVYDSKLIARFTFVTFTYGEKPDVRYDAKIEELLEQDQAVLNAAWNMIRWNLSEETTYTVPLKLWPKIMEYSKKLELTFGNEEIPLFLRANPHKVATLAYPFALFEGTTEPTERHVQQAYEWLTECGVDAELDEFTQEWKKEHILSDEEYLSLKSIVEAQAVTDMEEHGGELRDSELFQFFEHIARHGQAQMEEIAAAANLSDPTVKRRAKEMKGIGLIKSSIKGYSLTPKGVRFYKRWLKDIRNGDLNDPNDPTFKGHEPFRVEKIPVTHKSEVNEVIKVTIDSNTMLSLRERLEQIKTWLCENKDGEGLVDAQALAEKCEQLGVDVQKIVNILRDEYWLFEVPTMGKWGVK